MKKNSKQLEARKKFVNTAIIDNKRAAEILRSFALGLENCRTTQDIVYALHDILFLSERTIYNDFSK